MPAPIAGLPAPRAIVKVGPPLFCREPSNGSAMRIPVAQALSGCPDMRIIGHCRLVPLVRKTSVQLIGLKAFPARLFARIVLVSVTPRPPMMPPPNESAAGAAFSAMVQLRRLPVASPSSASPPPRLFSAVLAAMVLLVAFSAPGGTNAMPPECGARLPEIVVLVSVSGEA